MDHDFTFSGTASAARTDAGTTYMGLAANQFTNTNTNFSTVTFNVTDGYQTINPIDVTVTITGANNTTDYDGQEHSVSGYTAEANSTLYDVDHDFTFSGTASAARTDAGTTNMGLAANQFTNTNTNFATVTFNVTDGSQTITRKAVTVKADDKSKTYDNDATTDPALTATVTGLVSGESETLISYTLSRAAGQNAGTYTITPTGAAEQGNYAVTYETGTFTITRKQIVIEKIFIDTTEAYTYSGQAYEPGCFVFYRNDSNVRTQLDSSEYTVSYTNNVNVGTATLTVTDNGAGNYSFASAEGYFVIKPATVTVKANDLTKTYGDDDPTLTVTITGLIQGEPESQIVYTISRAEGETVAGGPYTITPEGDAEQGNYTVVFETGTLTINKRTLTVTPDAKSRVYGGTDPALTYTAQGLLDPADLTGALSRAQGETVGDYAITQGTLAANDNYTLSFTQGVKFTITPATLTVTADAKTKAVGEDDPALTYTAEGFQLEDTAAVITGALSREAGETVGDHAITLGTLSAAPNYTISFVPANLTILGIDWTLDLPYTAGGTLNDAGDTASFQNVTVQYSPINTAIGRNEEAAWIGFRFIAPEAVTDALVSANQSVAHSALADKDGIPQYSNDGGNTWKNFARNQDGKVGDKWYMQAWVPLTKETVSKALLEDNQTVFTWTYKFTWNGDRANAQTFTVNVDLKDVLLKGLDGTSVEIKTVNGEIVDWNKYFDVTFDSDGGSDVTAQSVRYNTTANKPADPTKNGKKFLGWFAPNATEAFDFANTPIKAATALKAHWADNVWTIVPITADSVASQDGRTLTYSDKTVDYSPIDTGIGRNWAAAWVGARVIAPESVTAENLSTVRYDREGNTGIGTDAATAKSFASGSDGIADGHYYMEVWVPLTAENVRAAIAGGTVEKIYRSYSFYFEGETEKQTFTVEIDPTNVILTNTQEVENAETIKVVNGKEIFTVTFDSNGGSAVDPAEVADGDKVNKPADPTKDNCRFLGWFAPNATEAFDFANTPITAHTTLTAHWADNVWTIVPITADSVASQDGRTLTYSDKTVDYSPIDTGIGRNWAAAWVGARVIAPESVTAENLSTVRYDREGNTGIGTDAATAKSFASGSDGIADGHYYMEVWVPLTAENVRAAIAGGTVEKIYRSYSFYFEGETEKQTFTVEIDPTNVILTNTQEVENAETIKVVNGKEIFTVTFDSNGGSAVDPAEVADGDKVSRPADPDKMDGIFNGWFAPNATEAFDFENTAITAHITLTARWTDAAASVTTGDPAVTVKYTTLDAALAAAFAVENAKVTLLRNAERSEGIAVSNNLTFDLNGFTLTSGDDAFDIGKGKSLTVEDSSEAGSGKIKVTCAGGSAIYALNKNCMVILNGGTLEADKAVYLSESASVTVNGAVIHGESYGIWSHSSGEIVVTKGIVTASAADGTAILLNGYAVIGSQNGADGDVLIDGAIALNNLDNKVCEVRSGTINGELKANLQDNSRISISGGVFTADTTNFAANGYTSWKLDDTHWTVLPAVTVTFKANEQDTAPQVFDVAVGKSFADTAAHKPGYDYTITEPTDPDNSFVGWFDGETEFDPAAAVAADTVYVAKWTAIAVTVTHNSTITGYTSLEDAYKAAQDNDKLTLLANVVLTKTLEIEKKLTIDLNGYNITADNTRALWIKSHAVEITGEGTIRTEGKNFSDSSSVIRVGSTGSERAKLTIGKDVTVSTDHCYGVTVFGSNTAGIELEINGKVLVTGTESAVSGNGLYKGKVTVNDGAVISATSRAAIYHPQGDELTINGGTITGPTAVYVKSGTVEIKGGTLSGNGAKADYSCLGDDLNPTGDALVVDNCGYPGVEPTVNVSGGTFNSTNGKGIAAYFGGNKKDIANVHAWTNTITVPEFERWVANEAGGYDLVIIWAEYGYALELADSININFHLKNLRDDPSTFTVSYGYGETPDDTWKTVTAKNVLDNKIVVAERAARQMCDQIHVVVKHNGVVIKDAYYSVKGYCEYMIANSNDAKLKDLCKATLDYGSYAQKELDENYDPATTVLANEANGGADYFVNSEIEVPAYAAEKDLGTSNVTGVSVSLITTSKPQLIVYFKTKVAPSSITVDGAEAAWTWTSDAHTKIKVVIDGILANQLATKKEIILTDENGVCTYKVSPVDYMGLAVASGAQVELNRAFYNYYVKAEAYFLAHQTNP